MATRKGQAVQTTWTYKEKGGLKDLKDIPDGCLSKGKLLEVLQGYEPQEAYDLLSRLLDGEGNGGTPRTLEFLVSKAKKLAWEWEQEKENLAKHVAVLEERLRNVLLEIPDPSLFDLGYEKVPSLITAGDVRYRGDKDQPPYVTQLRHS